MIDSLGLPRLRALLLAAASAIALVLAATSVRAEEMEKDAVYLPDLGGTLLTVHNPLGGVSLRGWDRPQIRIIARKSARSGALVDHLKVRYVLLADGRVQVITGFCLADRTFLPLPLAGASIDLIIDAPRRMRLDATTQGTIDATGFRSGAQLSAQNGSIKVMDVDGRVDTRAIDGQQWLDSIHGSLLASGVTGDVEISDVQGDVVDASVFRGRIVARQIGASRVHLQSTHGAILYVGALSSDGHYRFIAQDGDVRLNLLPSPFRVMARAPLVRNLFALDGRFVREAGMLRGTYRGGGTALDLVSAHGEVVLSPSPPLRRPSIDPAAAATVAR